MPQSHYAARQSAAAAGGAHGARARAAGCLVEEEQPGAVELGSEPQPVDLAGGDRQLVEEILAARALGAAAKAGNWASASVVSAFTLAELLLRVRGVALAEPSLAGSGSSSICRLKPPKSSFSAPSITSSCLPAASGR